MVTFYNTASEAYQYYFAGYQKADEVTTIYNEKTGDVLKTLFKAVENVSPSIDDIEAARVAGDENKAYYMTMAYGMQATAIIKGDSDLKYAAESFFTDINNVAICATDGCDREALIQNMEQAFCRADRKFGRWLANFRKQKFKASFAQEYVTLVATIPCASILYPKATT